MVKMIAVLGFGVVLFALSAAASWFVQTKVLAPAAATAGANADAEDDDNEDAPPPTDDAGTPAATAEAAPPDPNGGLLPTAARSRNVSVEELLRFGMGLKEREQSVIKQEDQLRRRQIQQQLALADVEAERREIDGMRMQVGDQLKTAEKLIAQLNDVRTKFEEQKRGAETELNRIKSSRIEIDAEQLDNTKRLAQWMQGMDVDKAAAVLKEMADEGKIESAVQILSNFEEREAAKILSAIEDPKLVHQFVEKFRQLKRPVKEAARR